jgi:sugar-specific transcriptional regulator TrmB
MSKLIEHLKEIGFNTYEAKVYIALLKKYPSTGYEISKLAEIPQSRTYDTLNVLTQKGIVSPSIEKPTTYTPIKPKELTKNYKKHLTQNLDYLEKHLPKVKEERINPIFTLTNISDIEAKILDVINSAKKELYLHIWAKDFPKYESALLNAYNRNVEIKIVSYEKLNLQFGLVYEHPYSKQLENHLKGRFIALSCDDKESLYGKIHSETDNDVCLFWTENTVFAFLMKEFITHDMMILDIQGNLTKELIENYGSGLRHLFDKIFGHDSIYRIK